jgi:hypothetical protein
VFLNVAVKALPGLKAKLALQNTHYALIDIFTLRVINPEGYRNQLNHTSI